MSSIMAFMKDLSEGTVIQKRIKILTIGYSGVGKVLK